MADLQREELRYIGRRFNGKKLRYAYVDMHETERHWNKQLIAGAPLGGVYEVSVKRSDDSLTVTTGDGDNRPVFLRRDGSDDEITELHALDIAAVTERDGIKHASSREVFREALAPIRKAMAQTNYNGRRAIIALVLKELEI